LIIALYVGLLYWRYEVIPESEIVKRVVYIVGYIIATPAIVVITIKSYIKKHRKRNKRVAPIAHNDQMECMELKKIRYNPDKENHILVYLDGKGRSVKQVRKSQDDLRAALKVRMIKGYSTKDDIIIVNCMIEKDRLMSFIYWCQCKFTKK